MDSNITRLSGNTGKLLRESGLKLAVAESCTGGFLCNLLTAVPGSSDYFKGGVIAYSNQIKIDLLGVPGEIIEENGAVSQQVAGLMASGVRKLLKTDIGISTTGIAGPSGGTQLKPVGMVVMGVDIENKITTNILYFDPPRQKIKESASVALLKILKERLEGSNEIIHGI